jgi:deaminated glutathione amidase
MSRIAIAGLQLEAGNGNNLDNMEAEIDAAMRRYPWIDMLLLAELNAFGASVDRAVPLPGPVEARFQAIARRHKVWLIPGSLFEQRDGQVFNTAPVINPAGEVIARYRKQYPWQPYEQGVTAGAEFVVFDVPEVGRFGLSICYDMWFPETTRTLAWLGAEVILHPSLTSSIDRDAELAIARASAVTNQCFFFDINLAGPLGVGQSIVAGPGGEVIYQAGKAREIIPLKIDLEYVREVRKRGWNNLSQPLKSFRDGNREFPPYQAGGRSAALEALGPLVPAKRSSADR